MILTDTSTKICKECKLEKSSINFLLRKDTGRYRNDCKECIKNKRKEYMKMYYSKESVKIRKQEDFIKNKNKYYSIRKNGYLKKEVAEKRTEYLRSGNIVCKTCDIVKPISNFSKNNCHWTLHMVDCKLCRQKIDRVNRDNCSELKKEECRRRSVIWRRNNPVKSKISDYNKTKRRKNQITVSTPKNEMLNEETWNIIKEYWDNKCAYCKDDVNITIDHVVPLISGGNHSTKNIVPACKSCNCRKHRKSLYEWKKMICKVGFHNNIEIILEIKTEEIK